MANIKEIKTKKGIVYKVQIRHKGYKPIYKRFYDKDSKAALKAAKLWADDIELQIRKGTYKDAALIGNGEIKIQTVAELIDYFKENVAPKRYSYADKYKVMYEWWKKQIGHIKIKDLSSPVLSSCKQLLITEKVQVGKEKYITRSNNTVNKYLMCLSAVLTYAVKELELLEYNPLSKIDTMKKPSGRKRFLSEDEIPVFTLACKNHSEIVLLYFLLLLYTGARYSEALTLQVENIDFKNSRVYYLDTKNGTSRGVGIKKNFLTFIKKYLEKNNIKEGYIFLNKNKTGFIYMRGILQKIIKDIGLKNFHIHDLRHTFASTAAKEGASLLDIALLLGHKSLVMARRYSHLTLEHTDNVARQAASSINIGKNIF